MRKIVYLLRETMFLIRQHKLYFLAPLLVLMVILAVLFFHLGPGIAIAFIYAGV